MINPIAGSHAGHAHLHSGADTHRVPDEATAQLAAERNGAGQQAGATPAGAEPSTAARAAGPVTAAERSAEGQANRNASAEAGARQRGANADTQQAEATQIRELAARDREVRAHEAAHAAVGGAHAGSPVYETQRGPNGVNYAVGGQVSIDVAPVAGDPEATVEKMRTVRRAALAPANPSPQDRAVAAQASRTQLEAQQELAAQQVDANDVLEGQRRGPVDTRGSQVDQRV